MAEQSKDESGKKGGSGKKKENAKAKQARKDKPEGKAGKKAAVTDKPKKKVAARDLIEVRESPVHGRGVYAIAAIAEGQRIIEYKGERISWQTALDRHPHDPKDPNHTFYFSLEDGDVLDAKHGGNRARWINHACEPNCEAREKEGRVFVHALRDIEPGEELFYDYGLVIDARYTKKLKEEFACRCGSPKCRGTMLAPKGSR
ncbi:SET domain-containing protein [Paracidovorax citrulli]